MILRRQLLVAAVGVATASVGALALRGVGAPPESAARRERPLVGFLLPGVEAEAASAAADFREGLREQGLHDGRDVDVALRLAEGRPERFPALLAELLEMGVAIIVANGNTTTQAAREATDRVPIVSLNGPDPVAMGWVGSMARPGGNLTGIGGTVGGLYQKAAELLAEAVPTGQRLAYLANVSGSVSGHEGVTELAQQRGLQALVLDVTVQDEVEPAFERAREWGADLVVAQNVIPLNVPRERLPQLAARARIPAASSIRQWTQAGFVLGRDFDRQAVIRRGAWYVARILAGANPGELPYERPTALEITANRTSLLHLGLSLPQHVAVQVTDWID